MIMALSGFDRKRQHIPSLSVNVPHGWHRLPEFTGVYVCKSIIADLLSGGERCLFCWEINHSDGFRDMRLVSVIIHIRDVDKKCKTIFSLPLSNILCVFHGYVLVIVWLWFGFNWFNLVSFGFE